MSPDLEVDLWTLSASANGLFGTVTMAPTARLPSRPVLPGRLGDMVDAGPHQVEMLGDALELVGLLRARRSGRG